MYNKETNIYTCGRCGNVGIPSIHPTDKEKVVNPELWKVTDVCTGCANYLRLGDNDPLIKKEKQYTPS